MEECSNGGNKRKSYHHASSYYYCYNSNATTTNNNNKYSNKSDDTSSSSIKKGPWKPEEDQVLLSHVNKYGPRDWSSIRSNGLLQRTGKSCRLRWVNKLRPNLKNGCKFTAEEEKVVIDMQAQIGNKWATIAKHLPGRTDNDVKNFWSSRQKRLARILHSQPHPRKKLKSSTTTTTATATATISSDHPCFIKVPRTLSMEGETSSRTQSLNSSSHGNTDANTKKMVVPGSSDYHHNYPFFEANNTSYLEPIPFDMYCNNTDLFQLQELPFPSIPYLQTDLSFPLETQELIDRLDSSFLSPFGCTIEPPLLDEWTRLPPCSGGETSAVKRENNHNPETPDSFSDDLPSDVFDQLEPLQSP